MEAYLTALLRVFLSMLLGGIIGFERAERGHDAGIRTHIMVCFGATLVMLISEFIKTPTSDPARMGAQVISGIGFLGVGCIITNGDKIKGLTTAAGLWTTACIGLAVGVGYYAVSVTATLLMLAAILLLAPLATKISTRNGDITLSVKFSDYESIDKILSTYKNASLLQLKRSESGSRAVINIPRAKNPTELIYTIADYDGVTDVKIQA